MNTTKYPMFNQIIGLLFIRVLLGVIFFFQGYGKVIKWGVENVVNMEFFMPTYENMLPKPLIYFTAYFTSYMELLGGLLLIMGLFRNVAYFGLALILVIVSIGHGMAEPIWNMHHVIFRSILLIPLFLLPKSWDKFALDNLIFKNN